MNAPVPGEYPRSAAITANRNPSPRAKRNGISANSSSKWLKWLIIVGATWWETV
ncbi:MAG: hypothetical protein PXY39_09950 [archaeon]|nr:hypothetical protein [archaeon]